MISMNLGASNETFKISNCIFKEIAINKSGGMGGVMYLKNVGNLVIKESIFDSNKVIDGDGGVFYYIEDDSNYFHLIF